MSELRAPDPTLTALRWSTATLDSEVIVDFNRRPRVGHRQGWRCAPVECSATIPSTDAAYIAVPCLKCFPDAQPPGTGRECLREGCTDDHNRHLAWQVT